MNPENKQILGKISLGFFWFTMAWWILAAVVSYKAKPYGGDPGVVEFHLFGILLPMASNMLGLLCGIFGSLVRTDTSQTLAVHGMIGNMLSPFLMFPLLSNLIHGTTYY